MKKNVFPAPKCTLTVAALAAMSFTANAQDVQLHYDLGRNIYSDNEAGRPKVTVTFENFSADQ